MLPFDGLPCAGAPAYSDGTVTEELGFSGTVVADYASVVMLMEYHHVAATRGEAARLALTAGLDMELPATDCYGAPLKAEIEAGRMPMEIIDTAVPSRATAPNSSSGFSRIPTLTSPPFNEVFQTPEQRALARKAVAESTILLSNDGVLPLGQGVKRVAIIGPGADNERLLQGDYHYPAHLELIYAAPQDLGATGLSVPQAAGK